MSLDVAFDWIAWLMLNGYGYAVAYLLGVMTALQTNIVKNSRQIRRNSETIRRNSEAAWRRALER